MIPGDGLATHVTLRTLGRVVGQETALPLAAAFFTWVAGLFGETAGGSQRLVVGIGSTGNASVWHSKAKEGRTYSQ